MGKFTARYYQRDAINASELGWEEHDRQVLKIPTGGGKNAVASMIIQNMQPKRCLFLADQDELITQPRDTLQKVSGIVAALEKAKDHADLRARVVVGSLQSMARQDKKNGSFPRLERYPTDFFNYIISDEVHRNTDRHQIVWDHFSDAKVLGMTATPFRANLADLSKWFESVSFKMDILDLVKEGFAPRPSLLTLPVEIDASQLRLKRGTEGKDFDQESVDTTIAPYYEEIAGLVHDNAKGRHGIAYLPLIRSSEAFAEFLRRVGLRAVHVDGTSENRDAILDAFARGEIDWLCNASLLSTGVDLPIADCFLNLKLTKSRSWYQQARGRMLRVLPGVIDHLPEKEQALERRELIEWSAKPDALLFDLLLQNDKLGAVHVADDFCGNEHDAQALFEKSKKSKTPLEIMETARAVQTEREAALVSALERAAIASHVSTPLTGDQIFAMLARRDLIDYVPIQRWEQEPVTEGQLHYMESHGIDARSVKSKGHASAIIGTLVERSKLGFATLKQVKTIRQIEWNKPLEHQTLSPESMTFEEASRYIDRAFKERRRAVA